MIDRITRAFWRHVDRRFDALQQEICKMSESLSQKLDDVSAAIEADVAAVSAEVAQLLAGMQPG